MLMIQTTWLCSAVSHMSGVRFIIDCLNIIDISLVRHRNVDYLKDVFFASSFIFSIEYLLLAFVYTHFFIYIYFIFSLVSFCSWDREAVVVSVKNLSGFVSVNPNGSWVCESKHKTEHHPDPVSSRQMVVS